MATKHYPIFLNYRQPVACNGFLVDLSFKARLLLEHDSDDEDIWAYGVNPGGICTYGSTDQEALSAFVVRLRDSINDKAEAAFTFETFKAEVCELFGANDDYVVLWEAARKSVREGSLDLPGLPRDESAYKAETYFHVEKIVSPDPKFNQSESMTLASVLKAA